MLKKIHKGAIAMMLVFGLLSVTVAPNAMAQGRCRNRNGSYSSNYYQGRNINDRNYNREYYGSRYDDRYDREDTTGNAVKRSALGAGIGALGGALIGGKKGALIGAGAGGAGGYIYHRVKVNRERDRYRY